MNTVVDLQVPICIESYVEMASCCCCDTAEFGRSFTFITALSFKMFGHKDDGSNSRLEQTCTVRSFIIFYSSPNIVWGHAVVHCTTSRKVAGSIPDGVVGIYH